MKETNWNEQYSQLYALARRLVYQLKVANWQGQEDDVAWDIVQETMRKVFEYTEKVEKGEREPVQSLSALVSVVARNYGRDLRRREWRLQRESAQFVLHCFENDENYSEVALEHVEQERVFRLAAHEIALFPKKQRHALLTDLARRMAFEEQPSILQSAFRAEGIDLAEYRFTPSPETERERNSNAALLNHAYNRLKCLQLADKLLA